MKCLELATQALTMQGLITPQFFTSTKEKLLTWLDPSIQCTRIYSAKMMGPQTVTYFSVFKL